MNDRFGIPDNLLGHVPEDVYGLVGHITMAAAIVEQGLFALLCTLDPRPQDEHAHKAVATMISECRARLAERDPTLRSSGLAVIDRIEVAFWARNGIIHNRWPDPTMEKAFGWRPVPVNQRSSPEEWIKIYAH